MGYWTCFTAPHDPKFKFSPFIMDASHSTSPENERDDPKPALVNGLSSRTEKTNIAMKIIDLFKSKIQWVLS